MIYWPNVVQYSSTVQDMRYLYLIKYEEAGEVKYESVSM